ncbi:unnamed protein product [Cyprideis torosa]|uniref:Uncharacterized protein n=1 Tax=Cyprideis torosa TaxID=163714 RepID=A0A7R8W2D2_9CRUS|nr:unnamed protein product [Cyprideis torosa]CAG0881731.1 unnamed protein product [Cyprideis torosa]
MREEVSDSSLANEGEDLLGGENSNFHRHTEGGGEECIGEGGEMEVANHASGWHVAGGEIMSVYRSFSGEKLNAKLGVHVGLNSVNVTLRAMPTHNRSEEIDFNERFHWIKPDDIRQEYQNALIKGLPYPILTVAEYFTIDAEGFNWGRHYRHAGYFAHILLWSSFAFWVLSCLLLCVVPRYGAYTMVLVGLMLLFTNAVYYWLLPSRPLLIPFENAVLKFDFGWCYWLILTAGVSSLITGTVIAMMDILIPHKFSHILEVDYGTAFDRHIIIEEQKYRRQKFNTLNIPKLEEPLEVGSRILRRLSTRLSRRPDDGLGGQGGTDLHGLGGPSTLSVRGRHRYPDRLGVDNTAFDGPPGAAGGAVIDIPKPWGDSPHLLHPIEGISRKSPKSVSFRSDMKPKLKRQADNSNCDGNEAEDATGPDGPCSSMSSSPSHQLVVPSSPTSTTTPLAGSSSEGSTREDGAAVPLTTSTDSASASTSLSKCPTLSVSTSITGLQPTRGVLKKSPSSITSSDGGRRESEQSTGSSVSVMGLACIEAEIDYNDEEEDFKSFRKGKRGSDASNLSFHPMPDVEDRRGSRGSITCSIPEIPSEEEDSEDESRW